MKKMMSFLLLATLLTVGTSCGQKNKVNSSQLGNSVFSSGIVYNQNSSSALSAYVNQYNCTIGSRRSSVSFYTTTAYSVNKIGGTFTPGVLSGTPGTTYVGRSTLNDIMIVSKVLNSSGALMGYNVEVAYCADSNNKYTPPYFAQREIKAFAAQAYNSYTGYFYEVGLTLVEPTSSSIGFATGKTVALVGPYQYLGNFYLETTFTY